LAPRTKSRAGFFRILLRAGPDLLRPPSVARSRERRLLTERV